MIKVGLFTGLLAARLLFGGSDAFADAFGEDFTGKPAPKVAAERPQQIEGVGIDEKLGAQLDLSTHFKDETGADVTLGKYYDGKTPVLVSPVYYACPGLCNFHLNGLVDALKGIDWSAGSKYVVLAISFDSRETPALAAEKKKTYLKLYDRPGTENGFHFLTGTAQAVKHFTDEAGFKYHWDEKENQWAHASAAIVTSPNGMITRYLPGIMFEGKDIRLAVTEAGQGKIGSFVDQLVLYCFHYNPSQSRYTVYAFNIMKLGGALMVLALGLWLVPVWVRNRRLAKNARSS